MNDKILLAGFGGQGILSAGKILAEAAFENDMQVSWLPAYGPEMRGGTCNCMVVMGDEKVRSPFFTRPTVGIIMNSASMEKYLNKMRACRVVIVNTSLVDISEEMRENLKPAEIIEVKATDIAIELGNVKCANIIMLGAYSKYSGCLTNEQLRKNVEKKFSNRPKMLDLNLKALNRGFELE